MTPSERETRLKFLGMTPRDEELLRALRPLLEEHVVEIEDAFYDHLLSFPETAQLLRDHTTVARLKKLQRDYLLRITEGKFDDAYFEDRLRIGKTHERVGLSPRWYLLAYNHYFKIITPLIRQHYKNDAERAHDSILALEKAFMLDASLAMDAYIASDRYRHLQQLESIVNDSADVIFLLDTEKRFRTWNRAAERVFGWRADEILGKHLHTLVPPEVIETREMEKIDNEIRTKGHCHLQTVRMAKDGRRVPVEITVSLLRDPQGNPMGRSAILRDISERKRLEEEKLRAERLAVIGAMSAKLAHEIRNPLSSIILNLDLVTDEIETLTKTDAAAGAESRTLLQSMKSEVRRIQRVMEDYLQFARLPKARREHISLNDLLARVLSFSESLLNESQVSVRTKFDKSLPPIHADEGQLWQAALNLIRNAIEAMPNGGELTLCTHRDGAEAVLTVADTGKGMTEQEKSELFKPFFSTKSGGTGLGLPLTQQIVAEHDGRIACESELGKGTTFVIHLPLAEES
jgi:PAS domain S-box-containing protein